MEIKWIVEANYVSEFKIFIKFNDGVAGIVDLQNKLQGPIFEELKDINYFKNFHLGTWTIEWKNGADLAPEFLYEEISKTDVNALAR